jgi:hypothetical protein
MDVFMAARIDRTLPVLYAVIGTQALLTLMVRVSANLLSSVSVLHFAD